MATRRQVEDAERILAGYCRDLAALAGEMGCTYVRLSSYVRDDGSVFDTAEMRDAGGLAVVSVRREMS